MGIKRAKSLYSGIFPVVSCGGWFPILLKNSSIRDLFEHPDYYYCPRNREPSKISESGHLYYQLPVFWPDVDLSTRPQDSGITIEWQSTELQDFYSDKIIARIPGDTEYVGGLITEENRYDWGYNLLYRHNKTGAELNLTSGLPVGWYYCLGGSYVDMRYLVWSAYTIAPGIADILAVLLISALQGLGVSPSRLPQKKI